jgi:RimJ/RimL family protein N-acetyltransferase
MTTDPLFLFRTERLRLREFTPADQAVLQAMHCEPRLRALLVDDYPLEQALVARYFLERMRSIYRKEEGLGIWHAQRRLPQADDPEEGWAFCGWFNLMRMPDDASRVEIGCRLLPEAWGAGLPVEGGAALLQHAFERLALPDVWGICHPQHHAVRAVLRTLGFREEGVLPYDAQPAAHFSIDRERWRAAAAVPLRARWRDAVRAERASVVGAQAEAVAA